MFTPAGRGSGSTCALHDSRVAVLLHEYLYNSYAYLGYAWAASCEVQAAKPQDGWQGLTGAARSILSLASQAWC